jgi:hypothetical protein
MFEIDLGVSVCCNLIGWYFYHHVGFKKGREAGLTLEGKEVALWRLTSISRWSKAKFKYPCNLEESPYVARIFLPRAIYENVDIVFIEIYGIH